MHLQIGSGWRASSEILLWETLSNSDCIKRDWLGWEFKNVQVLRGIPVNQFMDTMGLFSAALGLNSTGCRVAETL